MLNVEGDLTSEEERDEDESDFDDAGELPWKAEKAFPNCWKKTS